jgi:hypothetical protein
MLLQSTGRLPCRLVRRHDRNFVKLADGVAPASAAKCADQPYAKHASAEVAVRGSCPFRPKGQYMLIS